MGTLEEFRTAVALYGEKVAKFKDKLATEEATKVALILPFIGLLGYDGHDPTEVVPEHHADFSDKYKNRVDYAIVTGGSPVIAIECKGVGTLKKEDRGQLKSYFNAVKTIKLAILTDGVVYEFFVDSNEPNLMDDDPYLTIDFGSVAKTPLSDHAIENLQALTKQAFDPDTVADKARRSIVHRAIQNYLAAQFADPGPEFTRFLLQKNGFLHIHSSALETYRAIARAAFRDVFNQHVFRSLDIDPSMAKTATPAAPPTPPPPSEPVVTNGIVTTTAELAAFEAIRRRLAFLAKGDVTLFDALSKIQYHDYHGKMVVYFSQERKGRLVDLFESKEGTIRYVVPDGGDATPIVDLATADERLGALFAKRVAELG
jgi:hypothetical protein